MISFVRTCFYSMLLFYIYLIMKGTFCDRQTYSYLSILSSEHINRLDSCTAGNLMSAVRSSFCASVQPLYSYKCIWTHWGVPHSYQLKYDFEGRQPIKDFSSVNSGSSLTCLEVTRIFDFLSVSLLFKSTTFRKLDLPSSSGRAVL